MSFVSRLQVMDQEAPKVGRSFQFTWGEANPGRITKYAW